MCKNCDNIRKQGDSIPSMVICKENGKVVVLSNEIYSFIIDYTLENVLNIEDVINRSWNILSIRRKVYVKFFNKLYPDDLLFREDLEEILTQD